MSTDQGLPVFKKRNIFCILVTLLLVVKSKNSKYEVAGSSHVVRIGNETLGDWNKDEKMKQHFPPWNRVPPRGSQQDVHDHDQATTPHPTPIPEEPEPVNTPSLEKVSNGWTMDNLAVIILMGAVIFAVAFVGSVLGVYFKRSGKIFKPKGVSPIPQTDNCNSEL